MAYDRRRAALIACCVLAVVVAGSLFPAAGYGDYPTSEAVDSGFYDGESDAPAPDDADDDSDEDDPEESSEEENSEDETDEEAESEEDERTDEEETEEEPEPIDDTDRRSSESDDSSLPILGILLAGGLAAAVAIFWRVTDPTKAPGISGATLPSGFIPRLRLRFRRIPQLTMAATIGASRVVPSILDATASAARGVGGGLGLVARDLGRGVGTAAIAIPSMLSRSRSRSGSGGLLSLVGGLPSLFSIGRSKSFSRSRRSSAENRTSSKRDREREPEPDLGPKTIEEAWEAMVDDLPVRRRRTRTPGEYARRAIDTGLPERAVSELTDAFCDIRYGGFPPSPDRTKRARTAFEEIERARGGEGDGDRDGARADGGRTNGGDRS